MIEHGGTDDGPAPRVDASTNANPYGPSPAALAALQADLGPYPDPSGAATRAALAAHHGLGPDEVVLGAGATELIDRLVRTLGGPVLVEDVTFGEYAGAAARHGVAVHRADAAGFAAATRDAALAFVCSPGNPDGRVRDAAWSDAVGRAAAVHGCTLVWDLAYAPMVATDVPVPDAAVRLHAPNKAHGCTGLRAGWLAAPAPLAQRLRDAAVTWVVSTPAEAFLRAAATPTADAWVAAQASRLRADRDALVASLRALGHEVDHGEAPFALVRVPDGDARAAATRLRRHGVKVRPCDSLGLPGRLRLGAVPRRDLPTVVAAVRACLPTPPEPTAGILTVDDATAGSPA